MLRAQAAIYVHALSGHPLLTVPFVPTPVWHLFVVRTVRRDALQKWLLEDGIHILVHYPIAPHLQGAYQNSEIAHAGDLPISEALHREVLSLPIGAHLTPEQQLQVMSRIQAWHS